MAALVMVIGGIALFAVGGTAANLAVLDTSGAWWVRLVGLVGAAGAVVGALLVVRGFGVWYVGPP